MFLFFLCLNVVFLLLTIGNYRQNCVLYVVIQDMLWLSYDNIRTQLFIFNGIIPIIILQLTLNNISPCYKYLVSILSSLDSWFIKHFTDPIYIFIKLVTYLMALLITIINKQISISSNTQISSQCSVFIVQYFVFKFVY